MSNVLWVLGAVVLAIVLWHLFKVLLGYLLPPRYTGFRYLKQHLKANRINVGVIPEACLDELIELSLAQAILTTKTRAELMNEFVLLLEHDSFMIQEWLSNPNSEHFEASPGTRNVYADIFGKYALK